MKLRSWKAKQEHHDHDCSPNSLKLYDFQRRWLEDKSKLRLWLKSRRIGATFTTCLDHAGMASGYDVLTDAYVPEIGRDQVFISAGERQARELVAIVREHLELFEEHLGETIISDATMERIDLGNGSVIMSLPAGNLAALRMWHGDVIVDEFAFIPRASDVYSAAAPIAARTPKQPDGYRVSVISTPNAPVGPFFEMCKTTRGDEYSRHEVSIHDAILAGYPINESEERARVGDESAFRREYELSFEAAEQSLIASELYDNALCDRSEVPGGGTVLAGADIGRHRDPSALVQGTIDRHGVLWITGDEEVRGMAFDEQERWLKAAMVDAERLGIDCTGLGSMLAERLERQLHGVMSVNFSSGTDREEFYSEFRRRFTDGTIKVVRELRGLRNDVLSVQRIMSPTGTVSYRAPRNASGHCDRAIALGLVIHAAMNSHSRDRWRIRKSKGARSTGVGRLAKVTRLRKGAGY